MFGRRRRGKEKINSSADLQMFLMFMVLTIRGCDLLNLLPSSDRRELAGWPASLCHVYFQSLARLAGQSDKRETSCPQWRGMYQCVFVLLRAAMGESGGMLEDRYSWHFFQSPLCDPHLRVSERPGVGTESLRGWEMGGANCVSLGQLVIQRKT